MDSGIYLFVDDLVAEGPTVAIDRLQSLGVDRAVLALSYHRARDLAPHAPQRVVLRREGLQIAVTDDDLFGPDSLPAPVAGTRGPEMVHLLTDSGFAVDGWIVACHNTTIGLAHPEVTQRSCFGARSAPADLCPAQPRVRRYVRDLALAAARTGVDRIVVESLHCGSFAHGYHHERAFVDLGPLEELLLSWCFCPACEDAVEAQGGDPAQARAAASTHLDAVLSGERAPSAELDRGDLAGLSPSLEAMARARIATVTSLVRDVADAVMSEGAALAFIDLSGAALGYADGQPSGELAADHAWQLGIDPAAVAKVADYVVLAYAADAERVGRDLARYREVIGPDRHLRAVLRPGSPDTTDAAHLGERVVAATAHADAVDFYHYGLVTLADLARIPLALDGAPHA